MKNCVFPKKLVHSPDLIFLLFSFVGGRETDEGEREKDMNIENFGKRTLTNRCLVFIKANFAK